MSLSERLRADMRLPVIGSPMFIVSNPELVIAQCTAGIIGAFPALNARPAEQLPVWLERITNALDAERAARPLARIAPFAVNQIVHASNDRLERDLRACADFRVPLLITSLRAPHAAVEAAHDYGGHVFHDVINVRHAEKAIEAGVDGLIVVCAGAGGHAGTLSPFALVSEIRRFWDGPLVLSGAITRGAHILAAEALGADFAYMGTRFIATDEANAAAEYKTMVTTSSAKDIVYSNLFTGVHGNYLRGSIENAGFDPHDLPTSDKQAMSFGSDRKKAWKDIWGAGQGVGNIDAIEPAADVVEQLVAEYNAARRRLGAR
ncbi:nitronate monooxygenase family protein [Salinisphaera sp. LB1]|uniref:NAD(P)H-dependent flavin oxidoreductase n=1 Tax=Salinisphaera sp. LB1 TaxID=2183911 RepID=UPI000D707869|nr:nitronate monooxygenase family protein [Salinisphaera sp. LB1]AWN16878.1 Dioxygenases related to 2-nitropropane dioxygenase [Salinisphaera sp. LB1]